jgi:hypothetical protein
MAAATRDRAVAGQAIPLVVVEGRIAAIADLAYMQEFAAQPGEDGSSCGADGRRSRSRISRTMSTRVAGVHLIRAAFPSLSSCDGGSHESLFA